MIQEQLLKYREIIATFLVAVFITLPFTNYFFLPIPVYALLVLAAGSFSLLFLTKQDILIAGALNLVFVFLVATLTFKGYLEGLKFPPFYLLSAFASFILVREMDIKKIFSYCVALLIILMMYFVSVYYKYFPLHHLHDNLLMSGQASSNVIPTLVTPLLAICMVMAENFKIPKFLRISFYTLLPIWLILLMLQGSRLGLLSILAFTLALTLRNRKVLLAIIGVLMFMLLAAYFVDEIRIFEFFEVSLTNEFRIKYWLCVYRKELDFLNFVIGPAYPEFSCGEARSYYSSFISAHAMAGVFGLISLLIIVACILSLSTNMFTFFAICGAFTRLFFETDYFFTFSDVYLAIIAGLLLLKKQHTSLFAGEKRG